MKIPLPLLIAGSLALAACGGRSPDPAPTSTDGSSTPSDTVAPSDTANPATINPDASVIPPGSETPPARRDAEDPDTGTNSRRPDSPRDLQPGTDGNSPAVR